MAFGTKTATRQPASRIAARREQILSEIEQLNLELRNLRKCCDHRGTLVYRPDASCNSDYSYDCIACGASFDSPDDAEG